MPSVPGLDTMMLANAAMPQPLAFGPGASSQLGRIGRAAGSVTHDLNHRGKGRGRRVMEVLDETAERLDTAKTVGEGILPDAAAPEIQPSDVLAHDPGVETARKVGGLANGAILPLIAVPFVIQAVQKVAAKLKAKPVANAMERTHELLKETSIGETRAGGLIENGLRAVTSPASRLVAGVEGATGFAARRAPKYAMKHAAAAEKLGGLLADLQHYAQTAPLAEELKGSLLHVHSALSVGGHAPHELEHLQGEAVKLAKAGGHSNVVSHLGETFKQFGKVEQLGKKVDRWKDPAGAVRNLPKAWVKENTVHSGIDKGLWAVTSATSAYLAAHDIRSDVEALRHMVADLTQDKPENVTFGKMMFGKLPEPAMAARAHLIKTGGPRAVMEAANLVFNMNYVLRGGSGLLMFMLPMASMGVGMLGGSSALDTYKAMKANEINHKKNPEELYARLLGESCKELKARGGAESKFAQALGKQYAEAGYDVAEALRRVAGGQAVKDIEALQQQAEVKAPQAETKAPAPAMQDVAAVAKSGEAEKASSGFVHKLAQSRQLAASAAPLAPGV